MDTSPSYATSRVRRSSPYFSTISPSSVRTISRCRCSEARIACRSAMRASSSAYSSMIRCRSRAASRRSCMSRMAVAWTSSMSSSSIRPPRAESADGLLRISAITASSWSSALSRPRKMCARSSALRSWNRVRRTMTSIWCTT
jgi:hypothetical protein